MVFWYVVMSVVSRRDLHCLILQRPTINNAFILQTRPMSRGVINVIDNILWPPERLNQMQYKTVMDVLEDSQFSYVINEKEKKENVGFSFSRRLRILAERSEYFRSELRSSNHQTWFLPNDQAFASLGSNLNFLFDPNVGNNTNDINDVRFAILCFIVSS